MRLSAIFNHQYRFSFWHVKTYLPENCDVLNCFLHNFTFSYRKLSNCLGLEVRFLSKINATFIVESLWLTCRKANWFIFSQLQVPIFACKKVVFGRSWGVLHVVLSRMSFSHAVYRCIFIYFIVIASNLVFGRWRELLRLNVHVVIGLDVLGINYPILIFPFQKRYSDYDWSPRSSLDISQEQENHLLRWVVVSLKTLF